MFLRVDIANFSIGNCMAFFWQKRGQRTSDFFYVLLEDKKIHVKISQNLMIICAKLINYRSLLHYL